MIKKFGPYLIFFAAMLWATDAPFRAHLTQDLSSNFIVLMEHFFDIVIIIPIAWPLLNQVKNLGKKEWLAVLVIAVGGSALASVAFTQAFHYVNPSVAILLQKLQPLIAIGLAVALLNEKTRSNFWIWALVALAGAYLISFPHLKPETYPGESYFANFKGIGLALIAAALWGASTVMGKIVLAKTDFKIMTALRFVLAFVFLIFMNAAEHSFPHFSSVAGKDWLFIFIIAMASGAVSLMIYYRGLAYTKASVATLAELGFPMAAVIVNWVSYKAGWISQNTALEPMQIAGMAVLLFSMFMLARVNTEAIETVPAEQTLA